LGAQEAIGGKGKLLLRKRIGLPKEKRLGKPIRSLHLVGGEGERRWCIPSEGLKRQLEGSLIIGKGGAFLRMKDDPKEG